MGLGSIYIFTLLRQCMVWIVQLKSMYSFQALLIALTLATTLILRVNRTLYRERGLCSAEVFRRSTQTFNAQKYLLSFRNDTQDLCGLLTLHGNRTRTNGSHYIVKQESPPAGNCKRRFVCGITCQTAIHSRGGGGLPHPVPIGGYPYPVLMGGGNPSTPDRGTPSPQSVWMGVHPHLALGPGFGTPPVHRQTFPSINITFPRTLYEGGKNVPTGLRQRKEPGPLFPIVLVPLLWSVK